MSEQINKTASAQAEETAGQGNENGPTGVN